ncbi:MAG: serine hydrolase domain-containing protein, partial [Parvularcula sp.]|nr:serine hydrolase domain-containing protein [Parvularcula sp.]
MFLLVPILAASFAAAAPMHPVAHPTKSEIVLDGDLGEWPEEVEVHALTDEDGRPLPVTLRFAYGQTEGALYIAAESKNALKTDRLFLDVEQDGRHDRPADWTYEDGKVSPAQLRHKGHAQAARSADGKRTEWRIDLSALGVSSLADGPVSLGFGYDAATEKGRALWGLGGDLWFNKRRLGRLTLAKDDTPFAVIRGRTAWQEAGGLTPPGRVTIAAQEGPYRLTVQTDTEGFFAAPLPQGRYTLRADDSRTVPSRAAVRRIALDAEDGLSVGTLTIRRPGRDPSVVAAEARGAYGVNAVAFAWAERGETPSLFTQGQMPDGTSAAPDALFRMASVSKPVAAMVVLRLADAGLLDFDEPLAEHIIPEPIKDDPRALKVTPRMVLRHLSGLPNTHSGDGVTFLHDPGTVQYYSGEAFYWLRDAVEAKFGRSFQDLAEEYLFTPAGMTSSSFRFPEGAEARYVGKLHGDYLFDPPSDWNESKIVGGLLTTSADLGRFIAFMNQGAGLSDDLWADMATPNDEALLPEGETDRFGLGWVVDRTDGLILSHGGSEYGARTFIAILPEEKA